jgi:hypothetical protein
MRDIRDMRMKMLRYLSILKACKRGVGMKRNEEEKANQPSFDLGNTFSQVGETERSAQIERSNQAEQTQQDGQTAPKQHAAQRQLRQHHMHHQPLDEETAEWISVMLERLSHSKFRSSFHLSRHDLEYALEKGPETIDQHTHDFLRQRLGAAHPLKDGRQTPWRGHPVFTAQHATATCCRGCMNKWHHVPQGRPLSDAEIDRFSALIMAWIIREVERAQSGE